MLALLYLLLDPCAKPERVTHVVAERVVVVTEPRVVAPDHPLVVALVVNGQELWIGNDDYEPELDPDYPDRPNPARVSGLLKPLKVALDTFPLSACTPSGSKGVIVTFADKAEVVKPLGDLTQLDGDALGSQRAYKRRLGTSLVRGVELGFDQLASASAARKVMIVVSDGTDVNMETAGKQLAALRDRAGDVEIYAIEYKGPLSEPQSVSEYLTREVIVVRDANHVVAAVQQLRARICQ
jgi:hypothetical protein